MTNTPINNPQDKPAQHDASRHGYNPITLGDVQKSSGPRGWDPLGGRDINLVRCIAAPFFVIIFGFSWHRFDSAALCVIVLLGCLLARMDAHQRQLAAVPLSLAAIKLSFQLATYMSPLGNWLSGAPPQRTLPELRLWHTLAPDFLFRVPFLRAEERERHFQDCLRQFHCALGLWPAPIRRLHRRLCGSPLHTLLRDCRRSFPRPQTRRFRPFGAARCVGSACMSHIRTRSLRK